eukprot:Clim_evm32s152 gene=Clim_evmTU32s152
MAQNGSTNGDEPPVKKPRTETAVEAIIAIGANDGDAYASIELALNMLKKVLSIEYLSLAWLYESAPQYVEDQPRFLNSACSFHTIAAPRELLKVLKDIETAVGRQKTFRFGPRKIDLDIIYMGSLVHKDDVLEVPHPRAYEREFVLRPLCDIAPEFVCPVHKKSVAQQLIDLLGDPKQGTKGSGTPDYTLHRVIPLRKRGCDTPTAFLHLNEPILMGIINVTPDSFSDGGDFLDPAAAVKQAFSLAEAGAGIIDIGAQSTRPGADDVGSEVEKERVIGIIKELRANGFKKPISIDTFRSEVADLALQAGADIINDVSGGNKDPKMLDLAAQTGVPIILMHTRGDSKTMQTMTEYKSGVARVVKWALAGLVERAEHAGIWRWNVILDPGIGFAKTCEQSLEVMNGVTPRSTDHSQMLIGTSRKSFIGKILGKDARDRDFGTAATVCHALDRRINIIRVHNVDAMADVVKVWMALNETPTSAYERWW